MHARTNSLAAFSRKGVCYFFHAILIIHGWPKTIPDMTARSVDHPQAPHPSVEATSWRKPVPHIDPAPRRASSASPERRRHLPRRRWRWTRNCSPSTSPSARLLRLAVVRLLLMRALSAWVRPKSLKFPKQAKKKRGGG